MDDGYMGWLTDGWMDDEWVDDEQVGDGWMITLGNYIDK